MRWTVRSGRAVAWRPGVRQNDAFLVPINQKVAAINGMGVVRLPALILTHGTQQINLILALTARELFAEV